MQLDEGSLISIKNISLKKATFVKLRAQSVDFLEVNNPRALLEVALRSFTCLTVGDVIRIPHAGRTFDLEIREVLPDGAASIIETDCNVDFEEPLGYKESKYAEHERKREEEAKKAAEPVVRTLQRARASTEDEASDTTVFKAFAGSAKRIDGKPSASSAAASSSTSTASAAAQESKSEEKKSDISASPAPPVVYESKIGDKYSKKKAAVSAFTGTARKLSG